MGLTWWIAKRLLRMSGCYFFASDNRRFSFFGKCFVIFHGKIGEYNRRPLKFRIKNIKITRYESNIIHWRWRILVRLRVRLKVLEKRNCFDWRKTKNSPREWSQYCKSYCSAGDFLGVDDLYDFRPPERVGCVGSTIVGAVFNWLRKTIMVKIGDTMR